MVIIKCFNDATDLIANLWLVANREIIKICFRYFLSQSVKSLKCARFVLFDFSTVYKEYKTSGQIAFNTTLHAFELASHNFRLSKAII